MKAAPGIPSPGPGALPTSRAPAQGRGPPQMGTRRWRLCAGPQTQPGGGGAGRSKAPPHLEGPRAPETELQRGGTSWPTWGLPSPGAAPPPTRRAGSLRASPPSISDFSGELSIRLEAPLGSQAEGRPRNSVCMHTCVQVCGRIKACVRAIVHTCVHVYARPGGYTSAYLHKCMQVPLHVLAHMSGRVPEDMKCTAGTRAPCS